MSELTGRLPQNAVLKFRDEKVEPNVRGAAERALATLVSHSTTANARRRATEAELTKFTDAIEAPLAKLIHNDPESVRAIEVLRKRHLVEPEQTSKLTRNAVRIRRSDGLTSTRELPGVMTTLNLQPPFFDWTWLWWQGHEPFGKYCDIDGNIGIDARSGLVDGGASGFVSMHAGVGVSISSRVRVTTAYTWSLIENARYAYHLGSVGIGSNATAEGGVDIAVIDDTGARVAVASVPWTWFRKRISANESASGRMGPLFLGVPNTTVASDEVVSWTMEPGHFYIVNVGMWAFTDRSTGIGGAAVQSLIEGTVSNIWIAW